jgi:hypothetical protein
VETEADYQVRVGKSMVPINSEEPAVEEKRVKKKVFYIDLMDRKRRLTNLLLKDYH